MPQATVQGSPTAGPMVNGIPGAGVAISTKPTVKFGNIPVCTIGNPTGPTAPLAVPGMVMIQNTPISLMGSSTGTGATVTTSLAPLVNAK